MTASIAVVDTMSALLLSLMLSNANNLYGARNAEVTRVATDFLRLNETLRRYGSRPPLRRKSSGSTPMQSCTIHP